MQNQARRFATGVCARVRQRIPPGLAADPGTFCRQVDYMTVKELIEVLQRLDAEQSAPVFILNIENQYEIPIDTIKATWTDGHLASVVIS